MGTWSVLFEPRTNSWSPETYAIFGQDPATFEVTFENTLSCIHVDDRAMFTAADSRLGQNSDRPEIEYRIIRPTGETRVLRELARPKFDAAGNVTGVAGVVQDITEQKNAEQALLRAEKLKTIGQITGGIAHDFNNLLTVVGLNLEIVLDDEDLPDRLRRALEPALHAAQRGGELTAQMLSYARRPSLKPRVVSLSSMIQTLQPLLLRAVGERHQLNVAMPDSTMRLEIDPGQFENALMNIVINARDAMIEDGTVDISFAAAHLTAPLSAIPDDVPPGDYIRVRVADTGEGIDPAILPKIFEPFFTTKTPGTGTGLGLSMVQGFVQQSRGHMAVTSTPGAGTTIDLYLPIAEAAPVAAPAVPTRRDFSKQKRSVLLVEDGDALRRALHHMFADLGFDVVSVATAAEAREILGSPKPLDLLFSDITLPGGVNGVTLATEAEQMRPGIAVVLTSGNAHQIDPASYAKWPLLSKPFRSSAVAAVLGKIWP
jgi:PAS domain S-box-containing protein